MARGGWTERLKAAMSKSRDNLTSTIKEAFLRSPQVGEDFWEMVEEALIGADCGVSMTAELVDDLRRWARRGGPVDEGSLMSELSLRISDLVVSDAPRLEGGERLVALVVGVNGSGKTTTVAKLAHRAVGQGRSVIVGAADTFRAAAREQLEIWSERTGVEMISQSRGADPAAVAFDAVASFNAKRADRLYVDTAGRLHTRANLMDELSKVKRVTERESTAPVLTLLTMDANTGQNGIAQARRFHEALLLDGIILTKLDGTAKGGIVLAVTAQLGVPVWYVGVGEHQDDLAPFDALSFADALLGLG